MMKAAPKYIQAHGMSYQQALEKGFLKDGLISKEEGEAIEKQLIEPQAQIYGLRNVPKDAKNVEGDYMRISYKEDDEAFLTDQQRRTLSKKEMKKLPREVLQEGWDEDPKLYSHKRKPWFNLILTNHNYSLHTLVGSLLVTAQTATIPLYLFEPFKTLIPLFATLVLHAPLLGDAP